MNKNEGRNYVSRAYDSFLTSLQYNKVTKVTYIRARLHKSIKRELQPEAYPGGRTPGGRVS